jgi:hypothetical protein
LVTLAAADAAEALSQGTNLLAGATATGTVRVALLVGRLHPMWTDADPHVITDALGQARVPIQPPLQLFPDPRAQ